MPLTVEAVYENGVLKPAQPLPLKEHEKVQVTIQPKTSWVDETYGIIGWKGDVETLRRIAEDPEFSILEAP
jgi:predicted DNA-binding antitoxin AbrB/MazE fold protein